MDKKTFILTLSLCVAFSQASAETPLWLRKNCISPDGKTVAFCYMGEIFTVPSSGGRAVQLTSNPAYDSDPMWTADSKNIVFTSDRDGSRDIFTVPADGGKVTRLTEGGGNETLLCVARDGSIYYRWYYQDIEVPGYDGFPGQPQLFKTDIEGKGRTLVSSLPMTALTVSSAGVMVYEDWKGYEDTFRKHHTSSVTRDLWKIENGSYTRLTSYNGEDRNPCFAADGDTFYFLSEMDGKAFNVYRSSISKPSDAVQLTFETADPVRYLSVSDNGLLCYSHNGELYTLKEGSTPQKIDIDIYVDVPSDLPQQISLTGGATSFAPSPEGKEVAFICRGEVFVTSADFRTTRRITDTPSQERDLCFSKDGREIYYSAERDGCWGIYKTVLTDKKEPLFTYAVNMKEEKVSPDGETCFTPKISPDGKSIAYLRDRTEIVVKSLKGGGEKSFLKGVNYSYSDGDQHFEWSPDSQFILSLYMGEGGWNNCDIALINIEDGTVTDLTESGYSDSDCRWALGGKAMIWSSDRYGYRSHGSWGAQNDLFIMFFDDAAMAAFGQDKESEEIAKVLSGEASKKKDDKKDEKDSTDTKKPEKLKPVLEGREYRIRRLTSGSGRYGAAWLSPDGKKFFYIDGTRVQVKDIQKGTTTSLNVSARDFVPSPDNKYLYLTGSDLKRLTVATNKVESISFNGEFEWKDREEREYMFNHAWKQVKEKFYDPSLHGVDWDRMRENYSRFLPHIYNGSDFAEMLSEMLGELNGSHTGCRFYGNRAKHSNSWLGVIYDPSFKGPGAKIAEVLPTGVLSTACNGSLKAGDVVLKVEGKDVEDWFQLANLLLDRAGKLTAIVLRTGGKEKEVMVKPSSSDEALLYRRWVRQREDKVKELSGGKVGYVHIQGMDSGSYRELYSKALGKYRGCDALIVDTRHNGGGWLHDDLVTFLGGKEYALFVPRGQYIGHEPFNKWTKASCVVMGEDNYSDASGFPYAYRSLKIGPLIGAPVPGTMTAVWWERMLNSSYVFGIPQVGGWSIADRCFMENNQVEPDIRVLNDPGATVSGRDIQIEKAVEAMLDAASKQGPSGMDAMKK